MCGIFGFLDSDGSRLPSAAALDAVLRDLGHRGPDASARLSLERAAFAHTRLALLDLHERSNQPMWDATRRYCLLYNGEIYNFRQLRDGLEAQGCAFHTESDTEVLLQGLLRRRTAFLENLEGMFAFALYDSRRHRLLLARDRFGIKPLVYARAGDSFCFASEAGPLRHCRPLRADRDALAAYLEGAEPRTQGRTLFMDVRTLESGHYLEVDFEGRSPREVRPRPFFSIPQFVHRELTAELAGVGPRQVVRRLDGLMRESVRKHMIADVPVGSLLSGGLDSSLLTALAAREHPDLQLFHADVVGRKSERPAAERLARHLGLNLRCVEVDDERFLSLIPETVLRYEAPFTYHPNSVPFLAVAHLVREHGIKAILSGEGADESFLGYAATRRAVLADRWRRRRAGTWIPPGGEPEGPAETESLLARERVADDREIEEALGNRAPDVTCLRLLGSHLRTLMHRNDRLGMGASIEARFPFLDHDLIAFACNLSPQYKIRLDPQRFRHNRHLYSVKWPLRKVAEQYLPAELAYRRKRGFPTTGMRRLRVGQGYLSSSWLREELALSRTALQRRFADATQQYLVRFVLCDLWGRLLIANESLESVRRRFLAHAGLAPE